MNKLVLAAVLTLSVMSSALSAHANTYIDPKAPFDAAKFFNSISTGQ